jgi:hypothetical protein
MARITVDQNKLRREEEVAGFVEACVVPARNREVQAREMYQAYLGWARANGASALPMTETMLAGSWSDGSIKTADAMCVSTSTFACVCSVPQNGPLTSKRTSTRCARARAPSASVQREV